MADNFAIIIDRNSKVKFLEFRSSAKLMRSAINFELNSTFEKMC